MARTTYSGTCALCGAALDSRTAAAHLNTCAPGHDPSSGASRPLVRLRVTGLGGKPGVRLLARNNPLPWKCGLCRQPAVSVCTQHAERTSPFVCAVHEKTHRCEDAAFLPVVNSPRMGVCANAG